MKHLIQQVFHSGKFIVGFTIFVSILLFVTIYPLFIKDQPLTILGQGTFFPPGIYVSKYDTLGASPYILNLDDAAAKRIAGKLSNDDRLAMKEWLVAAGIPADQVDITDTKKILDQWEKNYDPKKQDEGMTFS